MDINDALRRVVMRHAWLIALCALLPAVAVFLLSPSGHSYASDARIAVASEVPRSNQEADALAAQVEAVATTRSLVEQALQVAHVKRDAAVVAAKDVNVTALGTSAIMDIRVTDANPKDVVKMAQAIADQVALALGQPVAQLTATAKSLQQQIDQLEATRAKLVSQVSIANPQITAQINDIDRQLTQLGNQLTTVNSQISSTHTPKVIDQASPAQAIPSSRIADAILAGALGLLLGLGIAAALESIRPTVVGIDTLAQIFSAPALGTVDERDGARLQMAEDVLAIRVEAAAKRVNVDVVVMAGVGPQAQLHRLARDLDSLLAGRPVALEIVPEGRLEASMRGVGIGSRPAVTGSTKARLATTTTLFAGGRGNNGGHDNTPATVIRVLPSDELTLSILSGGEYRVGMLVAAPKFVRRNELLVIADLVDTTGWPLLGVISMAPSRRSRRLRWPVAASTTSGELP